MGMSSGRSGRRAFWLGQLHAWHWVSASISLCSMLLFAFTGLTLNHVSLFPNQTSIAEQTAVLPAPLLQTLTSLPDDAVAAVPASVVRWAAREFRLQLAMREMEVSSDEIYIALPTPGGDAWLTIDRANGDTLYRKTSYGAVAYLNDLHKGRHTGLVWRWFQTLFALACIVFTVTGLVLLWMHGRNRPATWPLTWLSLLLPLLIALLLIH